METVSRGPRIVASLFVVMYLIYHAVLGLGYLEEYANPGLAILSLVIYLVAGISSVVFHNSVNIPMWQALANLTVTAIVPLLINSITSPSSAGSYATWYVVGLGTLMGLTAIRGHLVIGWLGFLFIAVQVISWGGIGTLLNAGIIGALLMVFVGHSSGYAISRAQRESKEFAEATKAREVRAATRTAARNERNLITNQTLKQAEPLLRQIVDSGGNLTVTQRKEAMLLEAELRDRIRGRMLISPAVEKAAREARGRGVRVEILDEGGLDDLTEIEREPRLAKVAQLLSSISEGKVTIRSPQAEPWRISFVAFRPQSDSPDVLEKIT